VHALHTVHAVPDLRMRGGRLGDGLTSSGVPRLKILIGKVRGWSSLSERGIFLCITLHIMTTYGQVATYGHGKPDRQIVN